MATQSEPLVNRGTAPTPKATILIVEDARVTSQQISDALRFVGFTVLQAYTAADGLRMAREHQPHLIVMDVQLPDGDGIALARTLKKDPTTVAIPIVVVTAYELSGEQAKSMSRTCAGFLLKPVHARQLVSLVASVLKLSS